MRIPLELADDLRYLAKELEWEDVDKAEVREALKANPDFFCNFWAVFAKAHRKGYRFCQETGFEKLDAFCKRNGIKDPYQGMYCGSEVDGATK